MQKAVAVQKAVKETLHPQRTRRDTFNSQALGSAGKAEGESQQHRCKWLQRDVAPTMYRKGYFNSRALGSAVLGGNLECNGRSCTQQRLDTVHHGSVMYGVTRHGKAKRLRTIQLRTTAISGRKCGAPFSAGFTFGKSPNGRP